MPVYARDKAKLFHNYIFVKRQRWISKPKYLFTKTHKYM